jgi:cysteine-rich repeat protein
MYFFGDDQQPAALNRDCSPLYPNCASTDAEFANFNILDFSVKSFLAGADYRTWQPIRSSTEVPDGATWAALVVGVGNQDHPVPLGAPDPALPYLLDDVCARVVQVPSSRSTSAPLSTSTSARTSSVPRSSTTSSAASSTTSSASSAPRSSTSSPVTSARTSSPSSIPAMARTSATVTTSVPVVTSTANRTSVSTATTTSASVVTTTSAFRTSPSSAAVRCGDGVRAGAETCDDGNTASGDGCSESCRIESGYRCTGTTCSPLCGDRIIAGGELCDDGNTTDGDGCSAGCTAEPGWQCDANGCHEVCGDRIRTPNEQCDDGNTNSDDGCDRACRLERGWSCSGQQCNPICGDGRRVRGEQCDDGNTTDGNGCSSTCRVEAEWFCAGTPSICIRIPPGWRCIGDPPRECVQIFDFAAMGFSSATNVLPAAPSEVQASTATEDAYPELVLDLGYHQVAQPTVADCGDVRVGPKELCDAGTRFDARGCSLSCPEDVPLPVPFLVVHSSSLSSSSIGRQNISTTMAVTASPSVIPIPRELTAMITIPLNAHPPVGETGPASLLVMASGAAVGIAFVRNRRRRRLP